ncbi:MAG: hypothetical protein Q9222_000751 [Ikaeria aurantiellina]
MTVKPITSFRNESPSHLPRSSAGKPEHHLLTPSRIEKVLSEALDHRLQLAPGDHLPCQVQHRYLYTVPQIITEELSVRRLPVNIAICTVRDDRFANGMLADKKQTDNVAEGNYRAKAHPDRRVCTRDGVGNRAKEAYQRCEGLYLRLEVPTTVGVRSLDLLGAACSCSLVEVGKDATGKMAYFPKQSNERKTLKKPNILDGINASFNRKLENAPPIHELKHRSE